MPDGSFSTSLTENDIWHRRLAVFNAARFTPGLPSADWESDAAAHASMALEEGHWIEGRRAEVSARAALAPRDAAGFVTWFEALERTGPGQNDPLFPWLAETATMDEMRWFLEQEVAGEAGFDDLTALTQMRLPVRAKLELARNYWDEMGRGNAKGMHGPMLEHLAVKLGLSPRVETTVWESLALANTMAALAANRRYAFQSVGALGVIEQTAPSRSKLVGEGTPAAWGVRQGQALLRPACGAGHQAQCRMERGGGVAAGRGEPGLGSGPGRRGVDAAGGGRGLLPPLPAGPWSGRIGRTIGLTV